MTKLLRASVLVLALSVFALADDGIIQGGKTPPPPTPPTTTTLLTEEPVEAADGIVQEGAGVTAAAEVSLSLLQSLLTLF